MSDARDRLMDALLRQHLGEGSPQMEQRYTRAFAALDAAEGSPLRNPTRARALRIARAALVVLCAGTMLLLLPVESNAMGVIASAASGESRARGAADERRYEVELRFNRPTPGGGRDRELVLRGNWDMRGDESRLELRASDGPSMLRVDARDGAWEQREGGAARALDSSELWPRWIEDRSGRIAVERMDELLRLVQRSYDVAFARAGKESPVALRGSLHLVADRRAMRPGKRRALPDTPLGRILEKIEYYKASVRAKVEHPFHIIKNLLGLKKVRYRGLAKNTARLYTLFGLANLMIAGRQLGTKHSRIAS